MTRDPGSSGVLVDFDGTLAPIVSDPSAARLLPGAATVLADLASRYRLVAVISGRPASWLAANVRVPAVARWGSYGLESVVGGHVEMLPEAAAWRPVIARVVSAATQLAPPGVVVEDKGISVTIHVRQAPRHAEWARSFATDQAVATGLVVHDARMSVELRPPIDVDKGSVVSRLIREAGLAAACYVGDDVGDLSAFRALGVAPFALRVAVDSGEVPPELLAAADLVVEGPAGVLDLLRALMTGLR